MPRSQPTTLETLLGRDPYNIIDVRGGGIFDDPDEEPEEDDVDARMRSGMQKAVAMMRGVGSEGAAIDALEALANDPSAEAPQLIKCYLDARLHQSQELKSFQGDHYLVALRQLANEALAFKASTQLSEEAYDAFLKQLADEAGFKSARNSKRTSAIGVPCRSKSSRGLGGGRQFCCDCFTKSRGEGARFGSGPEGGFSREATTRRSPPIERNWNSCERGRRTRRPSKSCARSCSRNSRTPRTRSSACAWRSRCGRW